MRATRAGLLLAAAGLAGCSTSNDDTGSDTGYADACEAYADDPTEQHQRACETDMVEECRDHTTEADCDFSRAGPDDIELRCFWAAAYIGMFEAGACEANQAEFLCVAGAFVGEGGPNCDARFFDGEFPPVRVIVSDCSTPFGYMPCAGSDQPECICI